MKRHEPHRTVLEVHDPAESAAAYKPMLPNSPSRDRRHSEKQRHIGHVHVVTLKERVQAILDGRIGLALETLNVILSVVLVILSVIQSYDTVTLDYRWFEIGCTVIFAIDYVLRLYAADERLKFVVTPMAIIDLLTILPTLITFFVQSFGGSVMSILRVMRVFRMLAVLRLFRVVQSYQGMSYELGVLVFTIISVIFVAAGVIQILDEDYYKSQGQDPLQFHQCVYFVFVTMSTVGYGDISPRTATSQMFVILMICVVVTVIPVQIQRLVDLSRVQNGYMHSYSVRKRGVGHVVVTGSINLESVTSFLTEFYRPEQGKVQMDVVILADHFPSEPLLALLRSVKYQRRVTFLKGSLLNDKDVKRVHVDAASAVFILADKKNVKQTEATDALTILQALAVDKVNVRNGRTAAKLHKKHEKTRCLLEVVSPQRTRGLRLITGVDVVLNAPRLRTAILAKSILCPGATALMLNLVCSLKEKHVAQARDSCVPWIAEYAHGLGHQLYPVTLPNAIEGMPYEHAALQLYNEFSVMIIAVYDPRTTTKRLRMCPFGLVLHSQQLAFVIAQSASQAQYAADSLRPMAVRSTEKEPSHRTQPPMRAFSSDTLLSRRSPTRARAPSFEIASDEETAQHGILPRRGSVGGRSNDWSLSPQALSQLRDHIIICGPFSRGHQLATCIDHLYHIERRETRPPILLLVKRLPTDLDLENLLSPLPENVFVEKGVSQHVEDLLHVRAHAARAVLMIPGNWKNHVDELRDGEDSEVSEHLLDYQVIMSTLSLRTVQDLHCHQSHGRNAAPTITCSVVKRHKSISHFAHKSDARRVHNDELDALESSTVSVKTSESWMDAKATANQVLEEPDIPSPLFSPLYAAGEVFVDSVLDTLLCQSFFNPYAIDLVRAISGDYYLSDTHAPEKDSGRSHLQELPYPVLGTATVAHELQGQSFSSIFALALEQQILVVAIFRSPHDSRGNSLPYVFTCPRSSSDVRVESGDTLLVLSKHAQPICISIA